MIPGIGKISAGLAGQKYSLVVQAKKKVIRLEVKLVRCDGFPGRHQHICG